MKRPAGLVIFASILFILGLRMLGGGHEVPLSARVVQFVIGIVSLAAAAALWNRRADAMKVYWLWVATWLGGGGVWQFLVDGTPWWEIAIWWAFVGTVWVAVGFYLKGLVGRTADPEGRTQGQE